MVVEKVNVKGGVRREQRKEVLGGFLVEHWRADHQWFIVVIQKGR